jgi:rfaE bifunctional protein kinase chain/domain
VALNIASLGAAVSVFSVIGKDEEGDILYSLFEKNGIKAGSLIKSSGRITTNKARIISRNQQMMRLDSETTKELIPEDENNLIQSIKEYVKKENPQVLIFEDYNKGVLTEKVIESTIALCKKNGILTAVDPKRKNFFSYKGVDIFKPNLKEVEEGLNLPVEKADLPTLENIHSRLTEKLNHLISFITLSDKGVFYQQGKNANIFPSHFRNISDVSGAGDTVIAVASLIYATTKNASLMAEVANIAGGLVCEEVGTVAINKDRLLQECKLLLD